MKEGINRVFLAGNVGATPELRATGAGAAVLSFPLATTESYVDRDGSRKEATQWHRVVIWGKRAEALSRVLRKGHEVVLEGGLRTHSWEKDGIKRYATEVHARELCFTSGRRDGEPAPALKLSLDDAREASVATGGSAAPATARPAPLRAAVAASPAA